MPAFSAIGRISSRYLQGVVPIRTNVDLLTRNICTSHISRFSVSVQRNVWFSSAGKTEQSSAKPQTDTSTESQPVSETTDNSTQESKDQINELLKGLEELKGKNDDLMDKYKRALADNENIRIRFKKQLEESKLYAVQNFCKDLLEVADVLNKATECVPKEELSDKNPHLKNLYEGLTMTETVLKNVFGRHGLSAINPLNEKFDPHSHEALFEQPVEGKEPGTVVVVSKAGYKLHDRVIRPALVGVSK